MTRQQFDSIAQYIIENGRVEGDSDFSFDTEFHFEAKQRGFSDAEIAEAMAKFNA